MALKLTQTVAAGQRDISASDPDQVQAALEKIFGTLPITLTRAANISQMQDLRDAFPLRPNPYAQLVSALNDFNTIEVSVA